MKKVALYFLAALSICSISVAEEIKPLLIGETIPDLSVSNVNGEEINLLKEAANQPLVLIFYRGGWCPYCVKHLAGLNKVDPKLKSLGYKIYAISPDSKEVLSQNEKLGDVSYTLLSDAKIKLAKAFGIAFKVDDATIKKYEEYGIDLEKASGESHKMLPVPAVFLVGKDGIIDFSYVNPDYKTRLDIDVLLAAAKASL